MNIPLPTKLEIKESKGNRAEVIIEPCYPGFGVTLGNALRRVLLSSLEGAAITSFKVDGAMHEFSSLPNVKEDLVELILNLKNVRLKIHTNEPVTLSLKAKGEKIITAGDIEKNSDVEIISTEQIIATLTDKSAELNMEFTVQKGKGYVTVEERVKEKVDLGVISIDAIYSPVVNIGFQVENVRVGERTDYDKVVIKIETDGSITPQEAMEDAAEILVEHFNFILGKKASSSAEVAGDKEVLDDIQTSDDDKELKKQKNKKTSKNKKDSDDSEELKTEEVAEDKPKKKRGRPKKSE